MDWVAEIETLREQAKAREAILAARQSELADLTRALTSAKEALQSARAERDTLQRTIDDMREKQTCAGEGADAALREAIARLGGDVARLWAERADGGAGPQAAPAKMSKG